MQALIDELKTLGVEPFAKKHHLTVIYNNDWTLFTVNYTNSRNGVSDYCRGLTFTNDGQYTLVARCMNRFNRRIEVKEIAKGPKTNKQSKVLKNKYPKVDTDSNDSEDSQVGKIRTAHSPQKDQLTERIVMLSNKLVNVSSIQEKVDGTLMMLYYYAGAWQVKCRYNFGDDYLSYDSSMTYVQLFWSFDIDLSCLDPEYTYLIEMCSLANRIIRKYAQPQLYLLLAIKNVIETITLDNADLDRIASKVGFSRPMIYEFKTVTEILKSFDKLDITFEGYVVTLASDTGDSSNTDSQSRIKIKNPAYLNLHTCKYRNYVALTPRLLKSIGAKFDETLAILTEFGFTEDELNEMRYLKNLNGQQDPRYHSKNQPKYCPLECDITDQLHREAKQPELSKQSEYVDGNYIVYCVCGLTMQFTKLRRDFVVPSYCVCLKRNGVYRITTGQCIYLCAGCGTSHECIQFTETDLESRKESASVQNVAEDSAIMKPRGFTSSKQCKIFRLYCHHLINTLAKVSIKNQSKLTKEDIYCMIAAHLHLPRDATHMSKMDVATCKRVIVYLQSLQEYNSNVQG